MPAEAGFRVQTGRGCGMKKNMQDVQYITGFTAGELTPWLSTRFELQAYRRGAALLNNFDVLPYGGVKRRRGTRYVGAAAVQSGAVRLVPFHFSEDDSLMLELYPGGMRVYRDYTLLTGADGSPYSIVTPWSSAEELAAIHATQVNDVLYITSPYRSPYCLERHADTDWRCVEFYPDPFPRESYLAQESELWVQVDESGSEAILESRYPAPVFTPEMAGKEYVLTDMPVSSRTFFLNSSFSIKSVDTPDLSTSIVPYGTICREYDADSKLYYFYTTMRAYQPAYFNGGTSARDYPDCFMPGVMRRTANSMPYEVCGDWELRTHGEWNAIWELWRSYDTVLTHTNCELWQWSPIRTLDQTAYSERKNWAISGSESEPCRMVLVCRAASSEQLSAHIFFRAAAGKRECTWKITEYLSERRVRAELCSYYTEPSIGYRTRSWSFGAFGARNGYPRFSAIYQGRLWLGGISGLPTTLIASSVSDFRNFRTGSNDTAALHLSLATVNQSRICWLYPARTLLVGTTESEWTLDSADSSALSATNAAFRRHSSVGSHDGAAAGFENTVLYVQRGGKRLREISYKLEADGYTSTDTSLLAEHLFRSGVREWMIQRGDSPRVWCVMLDGTVAVLTLNAEQQVTAWQRAEFPEREVLGLAALPEPAGSADALWLVLKNKHSGFISIECISSDSGFADGVCPCVLATNGDGFAPHLAGAQACLFLAEAPQNWQLLTVDKDGRYQWPGDGAFCIGVPYRSELRTLPQESERSFNSIRQEGRIRLRLLDCNPAFYYRADCAQQWEFYDPRRELLTVPYTGSVRVSQMPIPGVGQGFCLYVDTAHDFCLLALSIEFDFHGK